MTNVPAGTLCAVVMVVLDRWKLLASCEQLVAEAGDAANPITAAAVADCRHLENRRRCRSLLVIFHPPLLRPDCQSRQLGLRHGFDVKSAGTVSVTNFEELESRKKSPCLTLSRTLDLPLVPTVVQASDRLHDRSS